MKKQMKQQELNEVEDDLEEFEDADAYAFVIGPDGELRHLFVPEDFYLDPPKNVCAILKVLGVTDINQALSEGETLH